MKGDTGSQGPPGPCSGEVTYVRWGRTACPDIEGTEVVYTGRAGGTHFTHKGGNNEYLCLPEEPEYLQFRAGVQGRSLIYGAEYQAQENEPLSAYYDHNVPRVVCCINLRVKLLMITARLSCPPTWTLE